MADVAEAGDTRLWLVQVGSGVSTATHLYLAPLGLDMAAVAALVGPLLGPDIQTDTLRPVRDVLDIATSLPRLGGGQVTLDDLPTAVVVEWGYDDYGPSQETPSLASSYLFPSRRVAREAARKLVESCDDWRLTAYLQGFEYDEVTEDPDALVGMTHPEDEEDD
jgi:hypothetical protein